MAKMYEQLVLGARVARDRVDRVRVDRDNLEGSLYDLQRATKGVGEVLLDLLETLESEQRKKER